MELENFGRFLLKEFHINMTPDWEYVIFKYRQTKRTSKNFGRPYINFKVAEKFEISPDILHAKSKHEDIMIPRFISEYIMRLCGYSNNDIGKYYNRDHSTVSVNIKEIMNIQKTNRQIKEKITELENELL